LKVSRALVLDMPFLKLVNIQLLMKKCARALNMFPKIYSNIYVMERQRRMDESLHYYRP
jgi:hypothetical protein